MEENGQSEAVKGWLFYRNPGTGHMKASAYKNGRPPARNAGLGSYFRKICACAKQKSLTVIFFSDANNKNRECQALIYKTQGWPTVEERQTYFQSPDRK